jgi:transcriptional antiterminator RfaH
MSQWYVIQCKPREERRALEHLERQGFACYLPRLTVEKQRSGVRRDVLEPLFPGYLFIRLDELNDNWQPISSTRGVLQIVRFSGYPIPLRDAIVDGIRERLASPARRIPYLRPGDHVEITEGAFSDIEAIFVADDGAHRVVLLLNLLNYDQTLTFPISSVRKLALAPTG